MLVLEFLTSRRPTKTIVDDEFTYPATLHEFVNGGVVSGDIGRVLQMVDPDFASSVLFQVEEDRLMDLLKLALSCTHWHPDLRPKMTEVVKLLLKIKLMRREYKPPLQKQFSKNDLEVATNSFHQDNLIEQREMCTIYKGTVVLRAWNESTDTHDIVAVKRWDLLHHSTESSKCFLRELHASNLLKHENLVKMIGYSWGSGIKAIVLEYMKNGSLESIIHDPNTNRSRWTFSERIRVCVSVANALVYLHSECGDPVVHFNLKPSNVLFDEDWEPHLSIFGTSRLLGITVLDGSSCSTSASQSGPCYSAPEFGHTNIDYNKAEVYSFGMLILEFLTSRRPTETIVVDEFPNPVTLREFVDGVIMNDDIRRVLQLVDPDFASSVLIQEEEDRLMDLLKLALSCTHPVPDNRPKMTEVLSLLVELKII